MIKEGALVQLTETAKIQSKIKTDNDVFGIILCHVNMGKALRLPENVSGYEVMTRFGIELMWEADLLEVLDEKKSYSS